MSASEDNGLSQIGRALPGSDCQPLMTAIDQLYAAAVDPAQWPRFLSSMAAMMDAEHAFVCLKDRLRILDYVGLPQVNPDIAPLGKFQPLVAEDPRTSISVQCQPEYVSSLDVDYTMVVVVPVADGITHDLGLTRHRSGRAFDESDRERLNVLVPHLARAFSIRRLLDDRSEIQPAGSPASKPRSAEADIDFVRQTFSLSRAQARLAISLVSGQSVPEAAAALGIAESTARQYLKLIFQKTGWRRQVDIVRVVGHALMQR